MQRVMLPHELRIAPKDDDLYRVSLHTKELSSFLMHGIVIQHCLHLLNQALPSAVLADKTSTTLYTFVTQLQHLKHAHMHIAQAC